MKTLAYILMAAGLSWTGTVKEDITVEADKHPVSVCLRGDDIRYQDLLTRDDLLRYLPIDSSSLTVKIAPFYSEYGWVCYEWKSNRPDREMELWGERIRIPDINRVTLKFLQFDLLKRVDSTGYRQFDNLGDRSYWRWDRSQGIELIVEVGAARFTIETNVDAAQDSDLEKAVYFARQVLAKCIP